MKKFSSIIKGFSLIKFRRNFLKEFNNIYNNFSFAILASKAFIISKKFYIYKEAIAKVFSNKISKP